MKNFIIFLIVALNATSLFAQTKRINESSLRPEIKIGDKWFGDWGIMVNADTPSITEGASGVYRICVLEDDVAIGTTNTTFVSNCNLDQPDLYVEIEYSDNAGAARSWQTAKLRVDRIVERFKAGDTVDGYNHVFDNDFVVINLTDIETGTFELRYSGRNVGITHFELYQLAQQAPSRRVGMTEWGPSGRLPAEGYLAMSGVVVNGAIDYPIAASRRPFDIAANGTDFDFTKYEGAFTRNVGGEAGGEGEFQNFATNVDGITVTDPTVTGRQTNRRVGGSNAAYPSTTNVSRSLQGGAAETRPGNVAEQKYLIVDTYREVFTGNGGGSSGITKSLIQLPDFTAITTSDQFQPVGASDERFTSENGSVVHIEYDDGSRELFTLLDGVGKVEGLGIGNPVIEVKVTDGQIELKDSGQPSVVVKAWFELVTPLVSESSVDPTWAVSSLRQLGKIEANVPNTPTGVFAETFTPDSSGFYVLRHAADAVTGTGLIYVGTSVGDNDVFNSTADRITASESEKFYPVELEAGVEYHFSTQSGGGSVQYGDVCFEIYAAGSSPTREETNTPLFRYFSENWQSSTTVTVLPHVGQEGNGVRLQDISGNNSSMAGGIFTVGEDVFGLRFEVRKEDSNRLFVDLRRESNNGLNRLSLNLTPGTATISNGRVSVTDGGDRWLVIAAFTTVAGEEYKINLLPDFGTGQNSNVIYSWEPFAVSGDTDLLQQFRSGWTPGGVSAIPFSNKHGAGISLENAAAGNATLSGPFERGPAKVLHQRIALMKNTHDGDVWIDLLEGAVASGYRSRMRYSMATNEAAFVANDQDHTVSVTDAGDYVVLDLRYNVSTYTDTLGWRVYSMQGGTAPSLGRIDILNWERVTPIGPYQSSDRILYIDGAATPFEVISYSDGTFTTVDATTREYVTGLRTIPDDFVQFDELRPSLENEQDYEFFWYQDQGSLTVNTQQGVPNETLTWELFFDGVAFEIDNITTVDANNNVSGSATVVSQQNPVTQLWNHRITADQTTAAFEPIRIRGDVTTGGESAGGGDGTQPDYIQFYTD